MDNPPESDLTDFGVYSDEPETDGTVAAVLLQELNTAEPLN